MLLIKNLNQFYGQSHTLWDINLEIKANKCTAIMGRNGVGKTSLLKCIMGELAIASGNIYYEGQDISLKSIESRSRMGIAYVPQGRQIFPLLTVEENLQIGLMATRSKHKTIPGYLFELFPVLKDMLSRRGGDLSGGQQQQLAIARALVLDPQLLILDEPTEGIQPNVVIEIGEIIHKLGKEMGVTVLLVEQKLPFIRQFADNFFILNRGRNEAQGAICDLKESLVKELLTV